MTSAAEAVKTILEKSLFIEEALALGIINLSSLARYVQPEIEDLLKKKVETGAIVMALKRHRLEAAGRDVRLHEWLGRSPDLLVRSNLLELTYRNSDSILAAEKRFLAAVEDDKTVFFTFTRGLYETTIIASRSLGKGLQRAFSGEKLLAGYEDLSAVSLRLTEGTALMPGVYSFILKALFRRDINVMEVVSTLNEFIIILRDDDADKAFSVLKGMVGR